MVKKKVAGFLLTALLLLVLVGCGQKEVYMEVQGVELLNEPYKSEYDDKEYNDYYAEVTYADGTSDYMALTWEPKSSDDWFLTIKLAEGENKDKAGKILVRGYFENNEMSTILKDRTYYYATQQEYEKILNEAIEKGYLKAHNEKYSYKEIKVNDTFEKVESE